MTHNIFYVDVFVSWKRSDVSHCVGMRYETFVCDSIECNTRARINVVTHKYIACTVRIQSRNVSESAKDKLKSVLNEI